MVNVALIIISITTLSGPQWYHWGRAWASACRQRIRHHCSWIRSWSTSNVATNFEKLALTSLPMIPRVLHHSIFTFMQGFTNRFDGVHCNSTQSTYYLVFSIPSRACPEWKVYKIREVPNQEFWIFGIGAGNSVSSSNSNDFIGGIQNPSSNWSDVIRLKVSMGFRAAIEAMLLV